MKILLVAATSLEIAPVLDYLQIAHTQGLLHSRLYPHIDVLVTGVGIPVTAYNLGKYLSKQYDKVINAGIAGCFHPYISIGEVVFVTQDCFAEMGKIQNGTFSSFVKNKVMERKDVFFENKEDIVDKILNSFLPVNGITVNTTNNLQKKHLTDFSYIPHVETMEGAAVMYACLQEDIPCSQIRSISNYVEEQDVKKWNIPLAIKNLNEVLLQILQESHEN